MTTETDRRASRHDAVPRHTAPLVVADDHPLYRAGVVRALVESGRFDVVGEAGDGQTAYELIVRHCPDLAIVDVRMPQLDGLSLVARLRAERVPVPVLLLSAFADSALVEFALARGAVAYVDKQADRQELIDAAITIVDGGRVTRSPADPDRPQLLPIERSILGLLRDGWSPRDIPAIVGIDRAATDRYTRDAAARLGVERPDEAVACALAQGLLE